MTPPPSLVNAPTEEAGTLLALEGAGSDTGADCDLGGALRAPTCFRGQ